MPSSNLETPPISAFPHFPQHVVEYHSILYNNIYRSENCNGRKGEEVQGRNRDGAVEDDNDKELAVDEAEAEEVEVEVKKLL